MKGHVLGPSVLGAGTHVKTVLTAVMSSGPTPSPAIMVTVWLRAYLPMKEMN